MLTKYARSIVDLIVPRLCPCCENHLGSEEVLLCARCLVLLPYTHFTNLEDNPTTLLLAGTIPVKRGYSHIIYRHDAPSHPLLMALKYGHRCNIGQEMGRTIAAQLQPKGFFEGIDGIVPVPLHWLRWWKRGYNQSEQLARGISKQTGIPVLNRLVRRTRYTTSQTLDNHTLRRQNVSRSFRAHTTPLRHLLLVDDVLTTGATLCEMAKSIQKSNPEIRFSILTLAKA